MDRLDRKVYDLFLPIRVEFPTFTKEQLTSILKQRFGEERGLDHIANYACTHNGNARLAIECSKRIKQRWNKIDLKNSFHAPLKDYYNGDLFEIISKKE